MLTIEQFESRLGRPPAARLESPTTDSRLPADLRKAPVVRPRPQDARGDAGPNRDAVKGEVPVETPSTIDTGIDPLVLKWMPIAVPGAAVLLCASILAIWTVV